MVKGDPIEALVPNRAYDALKAFFLAATLKIGLNLCRLQRTSHRGVRFGWKGGIVLANMVAPTVRCETLQPREES